MRGAFGVPALGLGLSVLAVTGPRTDLRGPLAPGEPREDVLQPGVVHAWAVRAPTGLACEVRVDEVDVDVGLDLALPGESQPRWFDASAGGGTEAAPWIAAGEGESSLEVRAPAGQGGRYRITLVPCRPPTEDDRRRERAEALLASVSTHRSQEGVDRLVAAREGFAALGLA